MAIMNQNLKRYDIEFNFRDGAEMKACAEGDYVTYEDYQKLQEQLGKAEEIINLGINAVGRSADESWSLWSSFVKRARQYFKEKENP